MAVFLRASKWLVVVALTLSFGAHWAFLQSVAWAGMIVNYSRDVSLVEAVGKTFDGSHPCRLCKVVQQGRGAEKQQDEQQTNPVVKLVLGLVWTPIHFTFSDFRERILPFDCQAGARSDTPPTPPPRVA